MNDNQDYTLAPQSGEIFFAHIINVKSGKALDVYENSTKASTPIIQYGLQPYAKNQVFQFENVGNHADPNRWKIIAQHSKMVLDVDGGSKNDGAKIIQFPWRTENNSNQVWRIHELEDNTFVFESANSGKVIDIYEGSTSDKAKAIQFKRSDTRNQKFLILRVKL